MAKYCKFTKEQVRKEMYVKNKRPALLAYEKGEVLCHITKNISDEPIAEDEVFIKDYSENEGVLQDVIDLGIVSEPIRTVRSGFEDFYVCKLLI